MQLNDKYMAFVMVSYIVTSLVLTYFFGNLGSDVYYLIILAIGIPSYIAMRIHYKIRSRK